MNTSLTNLVNAAVAVLNTSTPLEKCAAAAQAGKVSSMPEAAARADPSQPPFRPARPDKPVLLPPGDVPKRRLGSAQGRATLLHAVAHIEFNAIDLAFDMAARFHGDIARSGLNPITFVQDWVRIGAEEAYHFELITARLDEYGLLYGDLPAHDGLWEAAERTAHDVAARLVIAPMILEARGLDVTPGMIERLKTAGDVESAAALEIIYRDEIGHVAAGKRWFNAVCESRSAEPEAVFHEIKGKYFPGALKPPFNHKARKAAGLKRSLYDDPRREN